MEKEFRIVGMYGNLPFDLPAQEPGWLPMRFLEFTADERGDICGAKFMLDLGRGYGFDHGEQEALLALDETLRFEHTYTDTSEGTWVSESCCITVRFIAA